MRSNDGQVKYSVIRGVIVWHDWLVQKIGGRGPPIWRTCFIKNRGPFQSLKKGLDALTKFIRSIIKLTIPFDVECKAE